MKVAITKITNGKPEETPYVRQFYKDNEGKEVKMTPVKKTVSDELRGYYFGAVIPFLKQVEKRWDGLLNEQVHEIMKKEFNYFEAYSVKNKRVERYGLPTANTEAKAEDMMNFIQRINSWVIENYGQSLPDPEKYKEFLDSAQMINEE